ncbi:MAG TPA: hypothetical protein VMV69_09300 [Pirellulales bacterium]|nr:hypothetical protein [Pirellulales bacterium]
MHDDLDLTLPFVRIARFAVAASRREPIVYNIAPWDRYVHIEAIRAKLAAKRLAGGDAKDQGAGVITTAPAAEPSVSLAATPPPAWDTSKGEGDGKPARGIGPRHVLPDESTGKGLVLRLDGGTYFIAGFGERGHLPKLKGFAQLAKLVASPGIPIPMLELSGANLDQRIVNDQQSRQATLDATAKKEADKQLRELGADIEQAMKDNDLAELGRLQQEHDDLVTHLTTATGIGGKDRDMNNPLDKLRPRIFGTLGTAYKKLRSSKPPMKELADHFESSISSEGPTFIYRPLHPVS